MPASPVASTPEQIKALTHPLRVEMLALFADETELTATRCAELTGATVASCSFHLRQLARYGYIERGEPRGKERPWRYAGGYSVRPDMADPEAVAAAQVHGQLFIAREMRRLQDWITAAGSDDPEWVLASTQTSSAFWATREELGELAAVLNDFTERFAERRDDPVLRPDGARRCHYFAAVNADVVEKGGEG